MDFSINLKVVMHISTMPGVSNLVFRFVSGEKRRKSDS